MEQEKEEEDEEEEEEEEEAVFVLSHLRSCPPLLRRVPPLIACPCVRVSSVFVSSRGRGWTRQRL